MPGSAQADSKNVEIAYGSEAVLARLPELSATAELWGQVEEMSELPFLLSMPVTPRREPVLVLIHEPATPGPAEKRRTSSIAGAVVLFAYGVQLFGRRLLAHPDLSGSHSVFGPVSERTTIAAAAALAMLQHGAVTVALSYRLSSSVESTPDARHAELARQKAIAALRMLGSHNRLSMDWTFDGIERRMEWPIESTLDETLRRVGKRTRRNLRAAMRLCERNLGAQLVFDVMPSEPELLRLNALSAHPARRSVARWRWKALAEFRNAFLVGLRTADGRWMGMTGGRRVGHVVMIDWQTNAPEFARYSVSLVMRGLLAEHFGKEGVTAIRFAGGTSHHIARAFRTDIVYTLRLRRRTLWLHVLEAWMKAWLPKKANIRTLFPLKAA